jgi:hypothetical protein
MQCEQTLIKITYSVHVVSFLRKKIKGENSYKKTRKLTLHCNTLGKWEEHPTPYIKATFTISEEITVAQNIQIIY